MKVFINYEWRVIGTDTRSYRIRYGGRMIVGQELKADSVPGRKI